MFYTRGFENTSLGDLARETGIPKGNFYHHFRSKDDVLRAVLEVRIADFRSATERWAQELASPYDRLRRIVEMMVNDRDDLVSYGCPTGSLLTELGKHSTLKEEALAILELYVAFVQRAFVDLGFDDTNARRLAEHTLARAQGAIVVAHAYGDSGILARETQALQDWLLETVEARHQMSIS